MEKLNVKLTDYHHKCAEGCCDDFGTITEINGVELPCHNSDTETILRQILEYLGFVVEIENFYEND